MKYITHNEEQISNIYSSEKGKLNTTYNKLIEIFGLPRNIYSGKIDVKWQIMFENGTYVEIYNWKNGINYVKNISIKLIKARIF